MAGGAYKGLTIRIGADTTKLSSALRGIDSAAYKTQRELAKLGKAATVDPKQSALANAQLGAMGTQATIAAAKMVKLKTSREQAMSERSKSDPSKTIGQLAEETDNAALRAAEATARYNDLNAAIEPAYKEVKKLTDIDLRKATNIGEFNEAFEQVKKSGKVSDETIAKIESMKNAWMDARNAMEDYGKVESLHNVGVDLQVAESQIRQIARSMAELNTRSEFSQKFKVATQEMGLLASAADTVAHRISRLNESMRLDPTNLDTAGERARALADALDIAEKRGEILSSQLAKYQNAGFEKTAEQLRSVYGSLPEALARTKKAYESTAESVAVAHAKMEDAKEVLTEMEDKSDGSDKAVADIERQRQKVAELTDAYIKQSEAHDRNAESYDTAKACSEMDNLKLRVIENNDQIMKLRDAFGGIEIRSGVSLQVVTLANQMKVISAGAETAKSRFDSLNNAMQVRPHSLSVAVERVRSFREVTDAASQKAKNLREQLDRYKAEGIDKIANRTKDAAIAFEQAQDEVNDLTKQLAQAEKKFGENSSEAQKLGTALKEAMTKANTAAAVNEYRNLQTQLIETRTEAKAAADAMKVSFGEVGSAAVIAGQQVGQLAMSAWRSIADSSTEVDASYRDLRKTFDATEGEYETLYDAAMEYGQANVTSAATMLEMESIAAQLGVGLDEAGNKTANATEEIRRFAEVAANLDVATNIDSETIALQMGQIANVMDLDIEGVESFGDALVRLGNKMPTQESNIMQITQRLSAIGDVTHFTTPQLMGWASAIASTGQKSEAAASGIATTITNIAKAVSAGNKGLDAYAKKAGVSVGTLSKAISENSSDLKKYASAAKVSVTKLKEVAEGTGKLEKFAEVAGMSAEEFTEAWGTKPSETLQKFIEGLKDSGDELFATLMDLDINGVRQNQTLSSLAQTVDTVSGAINMAEDAWNGGGDAAAEASKKAEGFSGTMEKIKNSAQVLGATFGDRMVPYLNIGLDIIQRLTERLKNLDDKTIDTAIRAGGLAVGFTTVYTALSPLVGAIGQFASGSLQLLVQGFAMLTGGGFAAQVASGFETIQIGAMLLGDSIAGAGEAMLGFAASGAAIPAILGALAGALVLYGVKKQNEAKKSAEEYSKALEGISGVTEDLGTKMYLGSDAIDKYAEKWSAARINMSDYHKELQGHIDAQNEAIDSMSATVGELEHYQEVINGAVGKGKDFNGNLGELQWAIDKLNEKTGESWTLQEILTGKFEDEEGAIKNTKDAIDKLIASKEREARITGVETALSENYAAQQKNKTARMTAADAYRDYADLKWDIANKTGIADQFSSKHDYIKNLIETDEHMQSLYLDVKKLREESILLDDQEKELSSTLSGIVQEGSYATTMNYGERESIMQLSDTMKEALQTYLGFTDGTIDAGIKGIAQSLQDAGVSTEQFAEIGAAKFSELAEKSGGDIQRFVELLSDVAGEKEVDVDVQANVDKAQKMIDGLEQQASEADAEISVGADTTNASNEIAGVGSKIDEVKQKAEGETVKPDVDADTSKGEEAVNEFVEETNAKEASVTVKADVEQPEEGTNVTNTATTVVDVKGSDKITKLKDKIDSLPKSTKVTIDSTTPSKKNVDNLYDRLKQITAKHWSTTMKVNVDDGALTTVLNKLRDADGKRYSSTYTVYENKVKSTVGGNNATGGYMPANRIPRHADGFIATRATLTDYGWIGEDGAEAYSGGSLVPLTNRKYSQPYINDISDAVARKLGPVSGGNQITVTVTGVASPDEVANAIARKLTVLGL